MLLRLDFALKKALINVTGPAQFLKSYSSSAHGSDGSAPDTSTSALFSREGSLWLRGYVHLVIGGSTNITAVKVRLRGFGPTTSTKGPTVIPLLKGDDVSAPTLYAAELSWSVSADTTYDLSFYTDRHKGFGAYDVQCIATAGGGAVLAGESAYVDIQL